jgi:hypothetical protein
MIMGLFPAPEPWPEALALTPAAPPKYGSNGICFVIRLTP